MTTDQRLAQLILHAGSRLRVAMSTALEPHGLTLPQYEALASLVHSGPTPVGQVPTLPVATDTLTRDLEPRGLVDTTHDDRDEHLLRLRPTDAGIRIERAASGALDQLLQQLLEGLSAEEKDHLAAVLERCTGVLGSPAGGPAAAAV